MSEVPPIREIEVAEEPPVPGEVERVGVLGAGAMGAGIAQLCAVAGIETRLLDADEEALAAGIARVEGSLGRAVERGRMAEVDAAAVLARLRPIGAVEDLAGVELVVEAVPEIVDLKVELLGALAALPGEPILASNTSSISIGILARRCGAPERLLGLHFFNPPTAMPLVELIATPRTDRGALGRARMLGERLGKQVVDVLDGPGFLVNRCARPYYMESLRMVEDGFAEPWEIDRACVERGGFPLGPFELMDTVGVDVSLAVTRSMWEQSYGEPRWRPSPIQVAQVAAGRLGRKTGGGFYDEDDSWRSRPGASADHAATILDRVVANLVNEAAFALAAGIATPADLERAMVVGLNHPCGPAEWERRWGRERVVDILDDLWDTEHDPRYRTCPRLRHPA
ncbi:MAG TPA: 3-hydroxyacyl-CoA dehydrogenase NAD-binding domain-containing protein [Solirubrobacterales bacterium]|nr:3-hydroxyacyl-CoA dehydrogenase NAD-binding domain-containing protein [Solirubrobacterales bacterium]